jgi:hypothetical protein
MSVLGVFGQSGWEACEDASPCLQADRLDRRVETSERVVGDVTRADVTVTTLEGKLDWRLESNQYTAWLTQHPIKELEQICLIDGQWPVPRIDIGVKAARGEVEPDGVVQGELVGWRQPGPWQDARE